MAKPLGQVTRITLRHTGSTSPESCTRTSAGWETSFERGSIYVVCPAIIGEFTPVSQRASVIAIYGAIQSLAGILAPAVNGGVIESAATLLEGSMQVTGSPDWSRFAPASPGCSC